MENLKQCVHPDKYKNIVWTIQKFSDKFDNEFKYHVCQICNSSEYTGEYRFVEKQLNRIIPSAKEQYMSKEKLSVSASLKSRFAKEGKDMSLKQFARMLAVNGDQTAIDWFANKLGACNEARSDKNKKRVELEKSSTKSARRSKKKGGGATVATATSKATK
jgi:hypothetical protein